MSTPTPISTDLSSLLTPTQTTTQTTTQTPTTSANKPNSDNSPNITQTRSSPQENQRDNISDQNLQEEEDYDPELYRCDVCRFIEAGYDNPIVFCDNCNLPVHKECYGAPLNVEIPDGEWICDRCAQSAQNEQCALCPLSTGIMKRTTDWRWVHLSCAQWIPECYFRNPDRMDPIDCLQIPAHRFQSVCMHCQVQQGATTQCSQPGCSNFFHITCGMKENIYLSYQQSKKGADVIVALCSIHSSTPEKKNKKK
jgi:NuA3 HAT complex component NTO1